MSAYLTFTREKTLDETDGPTDLQGEQLQFAPDAIWWGTA
jgi:hypothetical protein